MREGNRLWTAGLLSMGLGLAAGCSEAAAAASWRAETTKCVTYPQHGMHPGRPELSGRPELDRAHTPLEMRYAT